MLKITSTTGNIVKKAVIRDPDSAPQGQPGRIYIDCCGTQITVSEAGSYDRNDHNVCSTCGRVYDKNGWIKENKEAGQGGFKF